MKVLIVSVYFPPAWNAGGTATSGWNLARSLVRSGAGVHVLTTDAHTGRAGSVPRDRVEQGMRISTARVLRWAGEKAHRHGLAPGLALDAWKFARNADVCVMQGLWTLPVAAASRICTWRGIPYILCARGTLEELSLSEKARKKRIYMKAIASRTIQRAAAVVFASEREMEASRRSLGRARGLVLPNALEVRPLEPHGGERLRKRFDLSPDSVLVGLAGRIHPRKGFSVIVPALAKCSPRLHLFVFGADFERNLPGVRDLASKAGVIDRVHMLGHLEGDALYETYASLDLLALPSYGESFGNVVIEALSQGAPVMVSDQVPLGPYVEAHGLGIVVRGLDPERWAEALDRWISSAFNLDREDAARRIARDFDIAASGARWMDLLREIIGSRTPRGSRR